jgi:hypothetical protein
MKHSTLFTIADHGPGPGRGPGRGSACNREEEKVSEREDTNTTEEGSWMEQEKKVTFQIISSSTHS